jgi:CRISPR/Cas system-associated exonuclease Cas4 (RecB family)
MMDINRIWWKEAVASFKSRVEEILPTLCSLNSGQVTEGRDETVGGSEIKDCMLKVVLNKLHGSEAFAFTTLAKFFRGHRQEEFNAPIHRLIAAEDGVSWAPQVRVVHRDHPELRAHVDNVYFVSPNGTLEEATHICVIEEKNAKVVPDTPHDNHVFQLHYQMGLLKNNFPQAEVVGQIYGTDLNGEHTDFDMLARYQPAVAEDLFLRGRQIMEHVRSGTLPDPEANLLCGFCPHLSSCPSWVDPKQPPMAAEIQHAAKRYKELGDTIKRLNSEKDKLKDQLIATLTAQNRNWFKGQIDTGVFVRVTEMPGRVTYDKQLEVDHPEIAEKFRKIGESFATLTVIQKGTTPD